MSYQFKFTELELVQEYCSLKWFSLKISKKLAQTKQDCYWKTLVVSVSISLLLKKPPIFQIHSFTQSFNHIQQKQCCKKRQVTGFMDLSKIKHWNLDTQCKATKSTLNPNQFSSQKLDPSFHHMPLSFSQSNQLLSNKSLTINFTCRYLPEQVIRWICLF